MNKKKHIPPTAAKKRCGAFKNNHGDKDTEQT